MLETERHGARRKQRRFPNRRQSAAADRQDGVPETQHDQQDSREYEPVLRLGTVVDVEGLHPKNERSDETDRHRDPRPSAPASPSTSPSIALTSMTNAIADPLRSMTVGRLSPSSVFAGGVVCWTRQVASS
jgi:hypothetical protein